MIEKLIPKHVKQTLAAAFTLGLAGLLAASAATPRTKREAAPMVTPKTPEAKSVELHQLTAKSRVELVVLDGWPGCPRSLSGRQGSDLVRSAEKLKERGVQMDFGYPGPAAQLKAYAQEFVQNKA